MHLRNGIIAGVMAILGVVAIAGWTRKPTASMASVSQPMVSYDAFTQPASAPPCVGSTPVTGSPVVYEESPDNRFVSDRYVQSIHRPVRIVRHEQPVYQAPVQSYRAAGQRNFVEPAYETVEQRHGRSKKKSVAIVAGTAAGGAAIGALAGGGKGAGIGALSGGAAGFIYDRLTHNHH